MTGYVVADSDPLVAISVHRTPAQNPQREARSLPRQGRGHLSQWDDRISVGFFTETTGPLHNPETRRTPSYTWCTILMWAAILDFFIHYWKPQKKLFF